MVVAVFTAALRIQPTPALSNHGITADLANWIVTLLPAQRNDFASVAEVLAGIIASCDTTCSIASTNPGHHAFGTAKILDGIIRHQSAFLVHFAAEAKLRARVIGTVITTAGIATVTTPRRDQVVTTE